MIKVPAPPPPGGVQVIFKRKIALKLPKRYVGVFAIFEKVPWYFFVPSNMGGVPQAIFKKYHGTFFQQNDEICIPN